MSARRELTTRGIVIGRTQAGEGSVRVQLYTEELGFVMPIAKSAREERSKLRPHLTTGTYGSYALVKGERDWRIVGATGTVNSHFILSGNPAGQESSARVIGVVRQMVHGEGANQDLFDTLWSFLASHRDRVPEAALAAEHQAVLGILASLGYVAPDDLASSDIVATINKGLMASGLS